MEDLVRTYDFRKGSQVDLEVKCLSEIKRSPHLFEGPFRARFYQMLIVTQGQCTIDLDFKPVTVCAGQMVMIRVNQVYGFDTNTFYEGKMILFTENFFNRVSSDSDFIFRSELTNPININAVIEVDDRFIIGITELIEDILSRPEINFFEDNEAYCLLKCLLLELEKRIRHSPVTKGKDNGICRKFCNSVETYFRHSHNVGFYSTMLAVSEKTLYNLIVRCLRVSPKRYIEERLILEAKRMLSYTELSVKEISNELGFSEPTNFTKMFRKLNSYSPTDFRLQQTK